MDPKMRHMLGEAWLSLLLENVPRNLWLAYSRTILGGTESGGTAFLRDNYSGTAVELPYSHHSEGGASTFPPWIPPINSPGCGNPMEILVLFSLLLLDEFLLRVQWYSRSKQWDRTI
ncbi:hypothetical protein BDV93DRAFT_515164 [Ceratobasidium sp. AG-I]|nr:hypothetical protein BDV93DRAFT_515164 [Ceratobasidium sp. AG-I]